MVKIENIPGYDAVPPEKIPGEFKKVRKELGELPLAEGWIKEAEDEDERRENQERARRGLPPLF